MMHNTGKFNESLLQKALHRTKFKDLNKNLQLLINTMFGAVSPNKRIRCKKLNGFVKPDIVVKCGWKKKYVSIKSGRAKNIHNENIASFIGFLRSLGISEKTLKTIVLFHYGDGTLNGSGEYRYEYLEVIDLYGPLIREANKELNKNRNLWVKILERTMFQGIEPKGKEVDYVYFGDVEKGVTVSREKIIKYILNVKKDWHYYQNIHAGPIIIRPNVRYAHKDIEDNSKRQIIVSEWPKLLEELERIVQRYGGH